jgi:hypothetical protein
VFYFSHVCHSFRFSVFMEHWNRNTLYQQRLALTLLTSGGRLVGIVCLRTTAMEFIFLVFLMEHWNVSQSEIWISGGLSLQVNYNIIVACVMVVQMKPICVVVPLKKSSSNTGRCLWRGSISQCISGLPDSGPTGTVFKGPCSFTQNNPQTGFIWMVLISNFQVSWLCHAW